MLTVGCLSTGSCQEHEVGRLIFEQMPPSIIVVRRHGTIQCFLGFIVLLLDIFGLLTLSSGIYLEELLMVLRYWTVYDD